jgi:hypothetical protein
MADRIASHYSENLELAGLIAKHLQSAGKDLVLRTYRKPIRLPDCLSLLSSAARF